MAWTRVLLSSTLIGFTGGCLTPELGQCRITDSEIDFDVDQCPDIKIVDTNFKDLDELFDAAGHTVQVLDNRELQDISGLKGATAVSIANNRFLRTVLLENIARFRIDRSTVSDLDLTFTENAEVLGFSVDAASSIGHVSLHCVAACVASVGVYDVVDSDFVVDNVSVDLDVFAPLQSVEPLRGLGVPSSVRLFGAQSNDVVAATRAWLDEVGFSGAFLLCPSGDTASCAPAP